MLKTIILLVILLVLIFYLSNNNEMFTSSGIPSITTPPIVATPTSTVPTGIPSITTPPIVATSTNTVPTDLVITNTLQVGGHVNFIPVGVVVPYYPPAHWDGNAPTGWAICNGKNNTPDLRGRFVLGWTDNASDDANILGGIGGEKAHKLTVDELPSHSHKHKYPVSGDQNVNPGTGTVFGGGLSWIESYPTGGDKPHNNMPPYYVLVYIMRTI